MEVRGAHNDYVCPEKRTLGLEIIEEHFGPIVATVANTIIRRGQLCFTDLLRFTDLRTAPAVGIMVASKNQQMTPMQKWRLVQRALRVLRQHGLLLVIKEETPARRGDAASCRLLYDLNLDNAIHRLSFPIYSAHILRHYEDPLFASEGTDAIDAELVVEAVIKHGWLQREAAVSLALDAAVLLGGKRKKGGEEVRAKLDAAFDSLCKDGYLELVPLPPETVEPARTDAAAAAASPGRERKRQRRENPMEEERSGDVKDVWRVNYAQVRREMMYEACQKLVAAKHSDVHAQLVQIMLRLAGSLEENESETMDGLSPAVQVDQLYKKLPAESELSQAGLQQMLDEMYRDKLELLSPSTGFYSAGAAYHVNVRNLCRAVTRHTVETIVHNRIGVIGARMYRMLLMRLKLEQKQLERAAMVPTKESRIALYRMVNLNYIRVQEVPKTADYNPKNTIYIFEAKIEETLRVIVGDIFKTMHNMKRRLTFETNENADLFSTTNSSARPTEAQKQRMASFQLKYDALENALLRLNETLVSLHYLE